jgi:hypothetical protein
MGANESEVAGGNQRISQVEDKLRNIPVILSIFKPPPMHKNRHPIAPCSLEPN